MIQPMVFHPQVDSAMNTTPSKFCIGGGVMIAKLEIIEMKYLSHFLNSL